MVSRLSPGAGLIARFRQNLAAAFAAGESRLAVACVAAGGILRLVAAARAVTQVDEPIYRYAGAYTLHHGFPAIRPPVGHAVQAFLYHPPFFFYILAGWFWLWQSTTLLTGRLLTVLLATIALALVFVLGRRMICARGALIATFLIAIDPWTIQTNAALYLENGLLVLILLFIWAYWGAAGGQESGVRWSGGQGSGGQGSGDQGSGHRESGGQGSEVRDGRAYAIRPYVVAGAALGVAVIFKQIGGYIVLVPLINLLLTRGRHWRGHLYLFAVAAGVLIAYFVTMNLVFGTLFDQVTFTQLRRTLGLRHSPGLNYGVLTAIQAVVTSYWIFMVSVAALGLGALAVAFGIYQNARGRNGQNTIILSWATAGILFAGGIALKSPHYVVLWLVPVYLLLGERIQHLWPAIRRPGITARAYGRAAPAAILVLVVGLNAFAFDSRFIRGSVNTVAITVAYINRTIPRNAVVATENYLGVDMKPPYYLIISNNNNYKKDSTPHTLYIHKVAWLALYWSLTEPVPTTLGNVDYYCVHPRIFNGFDDHSKVCRVNPYRMRGAKP